MPPFSSFLPLKQESFVFLCSVVISISSIDVFILSVVKHLVSQQSTYKQDVTNITYKILSLVQLSLSAHNQVNIKTIRQDLKRMNNLLVISRNTFSNDVLKLKE